METAETLDSLGTVAWQQGRLAAAREYLQRALALQEKLKPGSLSVATSLSGLGRVAKGEGKKATKVVILAPYRPSPVRSYYRSLKLVPGTRIW